MPSSASYVWASLVIFFNRVTDTMVEDLVTECMDTSSFFANRCLTLSI
jgi:hypothetical protein